MYLVGGKLSLADVLLVECTLMLEEKFPDILKEFPNIKVRLDLQSLAKVFILPLSPFFIIKSVMCRNIFCCYYSCKYFLAVSLTIFVYVNSDPFFPFNSSSSARLDGDIF